MTKAIPNEQVLAEQLKDPAFARLWKETELANLVATVLIAYRAKHKLTQTALARQLGMSQPAVARLEAAEHTPSIATLRRVAQGLEVEIWLHFTRDGLQLSA